MDKPFKTIAEQVSILNTRGASTDEDTGRILEREGYYSVVNGYKDIFIDKEASTQAGSDRFKRGTRFQDIYRLFQFDRELKLAMPRYFHMAEATLKTICSYQFTKVYQTGEESYLDKKIIEESRNIEAKSAILSMISREPWGSFRIPTSMKKESTLPTTPPPMIKYHCGFLRTP